MRISDWISGLWSSYLAWLVGPLHRAVETDLEGQECSVAGEVVPLRGVYHVARVDVPFIDQLGPVFGEEIVGASGIPGWEGEEGAYLVAPLDCRADLCQR